MKAAMKKVVSLLLSALIVLFAVPFVAFAAEPKPGGCDCGFAPTIYVQGINTKNIYGGIGTEDQRVVFPPSADDIKSAIMNEKVFGNIGKYIVTLNRRYLGDALIPPVHALFGGAACNADGTPIDGTGIEWDYRTAYINQSPAHKDIKYSTFYYDWRVDPMLIARQLDKFISRVCESTAHEKVNLIGFSMGSVVTLAYIAQFGYDRLEGVLFSAAAFGGTVSCGEPFAKMVEVNGLAVARYVDAMLGDDEQSLFIKSFINLLYKTKMLDGAGLFLKKFFASQGDRIYSEAFLDTFVTMPGLWSIIPADLYEKAKADLLGGDEKYSKLIETIDNYNENVRKKSFELVEGIVERDIKLGIISKYGFQIIPCVESWDLMSDSAIDTRSSSFGAKCASFEGSFGEDYVQSARHDYDFISPDKQIDASACKFPERTWFVRGLLHHLSCNDYDRLSEYILYSDSQVFVGSNADYPQFMTYIKEDDSIVPMTAENCAQKSSISDYSIFRVIKDFGFSAVKYIKSRANQPAA